MGKNIVMGKKNRKKQGKKAGRGNPTNKLPFVSICTPTFNRRPFIPYMIRCFEHQTYPKDRIEWIILDDGTDKIEDLVTHIPQVKYFKYDDQMMLGKKRNLMHSKTKGDIIVYMDDDDYYPPTRIEHAVDMLIKHPNALCAGSSELYIYFKHISQLYQFGPYGPKHSTAGTFAFRRKLLNITKYDDNAALAEEKYFLKNYTIPFVQLEPKKTILVFSHIHNTFDKKTLLNGQDPRVVKPSDKSIDDFIKEPDLKDFYLNQIETLLIDYKPGEPSMKPEVLKQIVELKKKREQASEMPQIVATTPTGEKRPATMEEIANLLKQMQADINNKTNHINELNATIAELQSRLLNESHIANEVNGRVEINDRTKSTDISNVCEEEENHDELNINKEDKLHC